MIKRTRHPSAIEQAGLFKTILSAIGLGIFLFLLISLVYLAGILLEPL